MNKWKETQQMIRRLPRPPMPDAETFWQDFRRQASPRALPEQVPESLWRIRPAWFAPAVALASLLLMLGGWWQLRPAATAIALTSVTSIDVPACHDSLFILQDTDNQGTIIWIDVCPLISEKQEG